MADSRQKGSEVANEVERLSSQIVSLQNQIARLPVRAINAEVVSPDTARMRVSLVRACKGFRRLGNGSFALGGFIWIAFLTALFAGQLTLLPALIGGAGGLFFALVGYVFHMQADNIDLGDSNDHT
jgi:hypothetical protein